jgi:DNA-binding NtrC family response regulator
MEPLLLVEDKNELRAMLRKALERNGHSVDEATDGSAAIQKLRNKRYQMVLTDLKMPGASGLDVLRESKQADSTIPVILLTAFGSVDEAVSAMKEGAFDFIQKPVDLDHLKLLVERATRQQELLRENLILREEFASRYGFPRIVGESPPMQAVSQQLQKVATTETTVLLLGESGTGKELFARAIHHVSNRRDQPFIALNCAAIPESLVENELFGHERGAFTGAGNRKVGKIELAQRGTLFLDEIGELPLASQAKLLRVLEERRFERVGGTQSIEVDVRIVVATNRDLAVRIREKLFREDLYFRISAVPLTIPPLRERGDDIDILADHFLEKFSRELGKPPLTLSAEARRRLHEYSWPGNVRELQNALERAVILADGPEISRELLVCKPASVNTDAAPANLVPDSFSWEGSFDDVTARAQHHVERVLLENALKESRWNKTRAAEKLGITPKTLLAKMRATGLEEKA